MVEGRLQLDTWEDRNGGGQRSRLRVIAENIQFMNRRRDDAAGGGQPDGYPASGAPGAGGAYPGGPGGSMPRRPMDAPPMPEPDFGGDNAGVPEDDIPF